jgi:CheY-like chemotaxis protein
MISILLVEDDAILSYVVTKYVEKLGHKLLKTVVTADEAIASANALKPDLILMDIHLIGEKDGITAVETLRTNNIEIPVLYLTGNSDPANKKRMQNTSNSSFLIKPVEFEDLRDMIESNFQN